MKTLTLRRILELDAQLGAKVRDFARDVNLSTLSHDDNAEVLSEMMASHEGLHPAELMMYVWLQVYVKELRADPENVPWMDVAANYVGVTLSELDNYVSSRDEVALTAAQKDELADF
jgi:hypothetical protein